MTVGIAAIVSGRNCEIVTVSDQRLSYGDDIPSTEGAMKNNRIAHKWGMLFAATDVSAYVPILAGVRRGLSYVENSTQDHEVAVVQEVVRKEYEKEFHGRFFTEYLARFGYADISEFRHDGLSEMGKDIYGDYADKLARFDIGLELLVYGYGPRGDVHLFEVANPGKIISRDIEEYAAIGNGWTLAIASLNRKKLSNTLDSVIYRLLDAKIAAERGSRGSVGDKTHVITMNSTGAIGIMEQAHLSKVREIHQRELAKPEPADALETIRQSDAFRGVLVEE